MSYWRLVQQTPRSFHIIWLGLTTVVGVIWFVYLQYIVLPHTRAKFLDITPRPRILPTIVPRQEWVRYPSASWRGYQLPVLSISPNGRFGNLLMEYATLYGLRHIYNVSVLLHPEMTRQLLFFNNISLPDMPGAFNPRDWTVINRLDDKENRLNYASLQLAASGLLGPHRFISNEYPHEIKLFDLVRDEIRKELTWNKIIINMVQIFMQNLGKMLKKKGLLEPIFIGVHIRGTDYINHSKKFGGTDMPTSIYFKRAIEYYKNKYTDVFFIISSDDQDYIKQEFELYKNDFVSTPGTSPQVDMAILTACNHSIITLGTFSFWSGYLAGGEVLYPDITFSYKNFYFSKSYYEGIGLYFKPILVK